MIKKGALLYEFDMISKLEKIKGFVVTFMYFLQKFFI